MYSYFTSVIMNESFDDQQLINMFIDWLETTKRNKMEGLNYCQEDDFEYEIDKKRIKIKKFSHRDVLCIQFSTSSNRKDTQFIVECVYYPTSQQLDLYFKKEFTENSRFIPGNNMPNIFKTLLTSDFVQEEYITNKPSFVPYHVYRELKKQIQILPVVILWRNERCCLDPFLLSNDVLGLAKVICVPTKQEPFIQILYPNKQMETIEFDGKNKTTKVIIEKLQNYVISHHVTCTYDDLNREVLQLDHQEYRQYNLEIAEDTEEQIAQLEKEIKELEQENKDLIKFRGESNKEIENLEWLLRNHQRPSLLFSSTLDNKVYQQLILKLIKDEIVRLSNGKRYRRKDILEAIEKVVQSI